MVFHTYKVIHSTKTCNNLYQHDQHNFPIPFTPHRRFKCWGIIESLGRDVRIYDILTVERLREDNFRRCFDSPCGNFQ